MTAARVELPAAGRAGRPPKCPYDLAKPGTTWWRWAWRTPQATQWNRGDHYHVARRAQLEDDLEALGFDDLLDLSDLLSGAGFDAIARVRDALTLLKQSASGALAVKKEMRELETRLGLNPEGMSRLGWAIATEPTEKTKDGVDDLKRRRDARVAGGAAT